MRLLSATAGRDLAFVRLTEDEKRARLRSYGYHERYAQFGIQLASNPPAEPGVCSPLSRKLTGRPARTFAR